MGNKKEHFANFSWQHQTSEIHHLEQGEVSNRG